MLPPQLSSVNMLTPKQKEVLDFVGKYIQTNGYAPTLQEIAKELRKSTTTIYQFMMALEKKGFISKNDNHPRAVKVCSLDTGKLPVLGYIAAGKPIEPIETPGSIKVPSGMITKPGQYYALRVKGDSMMEAGVLDGDTVIVKHQLTALPGDMVVAITEKGATLKIFRYRNGRVVLESRNVSYPAIVPKELEIRGVFAGLIRERTT